MAETNPRTRRRIDQIKERIPIAQVLYDYGYPVRPDGEDREEQFPCDLHGDGHDNKPSARLYPDTNSWYCFACSVTRDAIDTVKAKENVSFMEAISILETRYNLPTVSWEEGDYDATPKPDQEIRALLKHPERTFEDDLRIFRSVLTAETNDRTLPMKTTLAFWEGSDRIEYLVEKKIITEIKGRGVIQKLLEKLHEEIKEAYDVGTSGSV